MSKVSYSALFFRNILIKLLGFIKSLIVLPFLTPAELGIYRYALTILGYSSYFHFGTITQLLFRYSELKSHSEKLERAKQLALYGVYVGSLITIIVAIIFLPNEFSNFEKLVIGIVSSSSLISLYVLLLLRVKLEFYEMARADIISQVLSFIFVLFGIYFYGIVGLIVGGQIGLFYLLLKYRSELNIKFPLIKVKYLAETFFFGFNLWLSSIFNQLMIGIDMLSLKFIFAERILEYGYYAFCAMMTATINNLLGILVEVKGQLLLENFREIKFSDFDMSKMNIEVIKLTIEDSLIANLVIMISYICIAVLVFLFLPKYIPAIGILGILFPSIIMLRWRNYFVLVLNKFNKSSYVSISSIIGVVSFLVTAFGLYYNKVIELKYYAFLPIISFLIVNILILNFYRMICIGFILFEFIKKATLSFIPSMALMFASYALINSPIYSRLIILSFILIISILYYKIIFKIEYNIVISTILEKINFKNF